MVETLNIAVCLFPNLTALDFQGAVELLGFISPENVKNRGIKASHALRLTYLSHSLEPVIPNSGPGLVPQSTYNDALTSNTQYDILLVPGGARGHSIFLFDNNPLLSMHRRNRTS